MTPEQVRQIIREELRSLMKSDRYTFEKKVQFLDGRNIQVGNTTGTEIATSALEKIGFHGVTPTVQQSKISDPSGGATVDSQARAGINSIIDVLEVKGLTASA